MFRLFFRYGMCIQIDCDGIYGILWNAVECCELITNMNGTLKFIKLSEVLLLSPNGN